MMLPATASCNNDSNKRSKNFDNRPHSRQKIFQRSQDSNRRLHILFYGPASSPPQNCPSPCVRCGLPSTTWTHPSSHAKRHLDRFSRFGRIRQYHGHTDTDGPCCKVTSNRSNLCYAYDCVLIIIYYIVDPYSPTCGSTKAKHSLLIYCHL